MSMGYRERFKLILFPEVGDDCSVLIRNPALMPPEQLEPAAVPLGEDGQPLDREAATASTYEVLKNLIVAWKMYETTAPEMPSDVADVEDLDLLLKTLNNTEQKRLGAITVENIGRCPLVVLNKLADELNKAVASPQ